MIVGALAAFTLWYCSLCTNLAFSQEDGTIEYAENGMGPVATYTAMDPEGDDVTWSVTGANASAFTIDGGVLMFNDSPDYESGTVSYSVTVVATDGNESGTKPVTIEIMNIDEPGEVTLTGRQPQAGVPLMVTVTDPDGPVALGGLKWQWETSSSMSGPWIPVVGATMASYTPKNEDATPTRMYLRAVATYKDAENADTEKMASAMAEYAVRPTLAGNTPPVFQDSEGEEIADDTAIEREVAEGTAAGQPVGAPVAATDANASDILTYMLGTGEDDESFTIDWATGQIMVGSGTTLEADSEQDGFRAVYMVQVTAIDPFGTTSSSDATNSDTMMVTINVTAVEEAPSVDFVTFDSSGDCLDGRS